LKTVHANTHPRASEVIVLANEMIQRLRKMSRTGLLKPQRNLVITVGVIFKHGIETTLLNIGSGQIWAGSQQR
jgi:hypothetical protein